MTKRKMDPDSKGEAGELPTAFTMKSGKTPMFKYMGSSPMKDDDPELAELIKSRIVRTEKEYDADGNVTKRIHFDKNNKIISTATTKHYQGDK